MLTTFARTAGLYGLAVASVAVRRTAARVCLYVLVLVLGVVGLGFLSAAAFMAISQGLGPVYASLIVGCAYLVAALIALLAALLRRRW
jgi:polyferredoxin